MQERSGAQKCEREDDLITFLYGECNETEARNFQQHLRTCAACESDLAGFKQIRESMTAWRHEVLGATEAAQLDTVTTASPVTRSAVDALREFFNLSPLWLKGVVAFASILFCIFAALALINRDRSKPSTASNDNKLYTQEELDKRIDEAIAATKQQLTGDKEGMAEGQAESQSDQPAAIDRDSAATDRDSVATHSKKGQRRPLTKSEREQLAADLRLVSSSDELSLDLLGDRINQEE